MRFEPFIGLRWRELTHRFADKLPTPSILGCEYFFVCDTRRHIAPTTSGDDDLVPWGFILFKKMDMKSLP